MDIFIKRQNTKTHSRKNRQVKSPIFISQIGDFYQILKDK